jgi:hypothetical protein
MKNHETPWAKEVLAIVDHSFIFFAGASNGFALELEIDNLQEWSNTESWT